MESSRIVRPIETKHVRLRLMKPLILLLIVFCISCNSNESRTAAIVPDKEQMRTKNLGLASIDSGKLLEAIKYFQSLEKLLPAEASVYGNQGLVALRQNKLQEAGNLLAKANSLAPGHPEIAILQSQVFSLTGNFDEAKEILNTSLSKNSGNIQLLWALAEQSRGDDAAQLDAVTKILQYAPENVVARLAATKALLGLNILDDAKTHLEYLSAQEIITDETAKTLYSNALEKIKTGDSRLAKSQVIGLDNVLKPSRAWQHSLLEVAGPPGTIGHPIRHFINIQEPRQLQRKREMAPTWTPVVAGLYPNTNNHVQPSLGSIGHQLLLVESDSRSELLVTSGSRIDALNDAGDAIDVGSNITQLATIDWNNDRFLDIAVGTENGSVFIFKQDATWQLHELQGPTSSPIKALCAWDADQDGDLDLLISNSQTVLLQNNGDNSSTSLQLNAPPLRSPNIIDVDEDGAVDIAAIDENNAFFILKNKRSGKIEAHNKWLIGTTMQDLVVGDVNNDGWLDVAWIGKDGNAYHGINQGGSGFEQQSIRGNGRQIQLLDSNNSGWLETLIIGDEIQVISPEWEMTIPSTGQTQIVDADLDGQLDLIIVDKTGFSTLWQQENQNANKYQKISLEAILEGGQRNNSFGIGGFIEIKSGGKYQKRLITDPMTHVGLGDEPADVIRVVWPNGVPQDVVNPIPNQTFTEVQILKGSCPFLATKQNGNWTFVTDLLWRSPLGLKINAQTVPPIAATQDWVKVESSELQARGGVYELAITAQLWETHFIDEVKLIAIDHPVGTEIFVDERFLAPVPPEFKLYAYQQLLAPIAAKTHHGENVLELVLEKDERRVGHFEKGAYQGIGEDHYLELTLPKNIDMNNEIHLIASGWIRPTDTSINVAIGQGKHPAPQSLEIQVAGEVGEWKTIIPNAGFPAGKLKTVVLELPASSMKHNDARIRIKTNLEIYWDCIQFAEGNKPVKVIKTPLNLQGADLSYMGYPKMSRKNQNAPNIPDYSDIQHYAAWRDLEGFYTRYGCVAPLLDAIDDRYVIMNAGDAMYLTFEEPKDIIEPGMIRDYIFFSDGWVKDGDWNTVESRTVGPLPHHSMSDYPYPSSETPLELLPSHSDWIEYHTRFISPAPFRDAIKH